MKIRYAQVQEIPQLQQLFAQLNALMADYQPSSCRPGVQAAEFLQMIIGQETSDILVADVDGMPVGVALVVRQQTPPYDVCVPHDYAYLMDLCVAESSRGQGIGTALLDAVRDWAKQRNLDYVELSVLPENKRAAALYRRSGYQDVLHRLRMDIK